VPSDTLNLTKVLKLVFGTGAGKVDQVFHEVMKKYGVLVSEAAVKQQLFREGIDPKRATDQQKVMARWNLILQGTTAAQGDAIRSAGSFANQMKALKAQIADTAVVVGSALLPVITPLVTQMAGAAQQVAVRVGGHEELVVTAAKVAAGLTLASSAVVGFGAVARTAATAVGLLSGALKGLRAVLALLVAHPVVAVIVGIGAAAIVAWGALRKLVSSSDALRDSLSRAAQVAGQMWDAFTAAIRPALAELSAAIGEVLKPLEAALADLLRTAGDVAAKFVVMGTEFARLGAILLRHSGVIETITIGLRYMVNQLKVAAVATALMAGGVADALSAVDALASAAGLSLDATAESATRAANALQKVKKEAASESGGSAAPAEASGTGAGTAARAAEEELRWARRVHQLQLQQIEDRFAREKALVNERYDHEIKQAQKAGATKKQLDDMERARALELAEIKQRQAEAEREQYNESSDRVSQLSVEVADLKVAGQHTGAARELAMLNRQQSEEEFAVPWDSPNRDEELLLIRQKYGLKREAVTGATQQQYADETLRLQNELAGGTQFDRQRLHVSDELAKALKDTMGVIDPSVVRERFKLQFDLIDQREAEAAKARERISTQGTFQGGVAWRALGAQTDSQRIVKATEQTAKGVENIHREQKHNKGPTFG